MIGVKRDRRIVGPQGPQGLQGEKGQDGIDGEQGIQGIQGEKGEDGAQGIQGETGTVDTSYLSYSTSETLTGGTWIDGKPIYRKVVTYLQSEFEPMSHIMDITSKLPSELETVCSYYHKCINDSDYKIEGNIIASGVFVSVVNSMQVINDNSFYILYIEVNGAPAAVIGSLLDNFQIILEYTKTTD